MGASILAFGFPTSLYQRVSKIKIDNSRKGRALEAVEYVTHIPSKRQSTETQSPERYRPYSQLVVYPNSLTLSFWNSAYCLYIQPEVAVATWSMFQTVYTQLHIRVRLNSDYLPLQSTDEDQNGHFDVTRDDWQQFWHIPLHQPLRTVVDCSSDLFLTKPHLAQSPEP